ncbi:hypothetical protein AB4349_06815 [Vibrio breoganii]
MGKFFLPLADAIQSVVDIRDVAAVVVESLLGNGQGHYAEVTDTVERVTGKPARSFKAFAQEFAKVVE